MTIPDMYPIICTLLEILFTGTATSKSIYAYLLYIRLLLEKSPEIAPTVAYNDVTQYGMEFPNGVYFSIMYDGENKTTSVFLAPDSSLVKAIQIVHVAGEILVVQSVTFPVTAYYEFQPKGRLPVFKAPVQGLLE